MRVRALVSNAIVGLAVTFGPVSAQDPDPVRLTLEQALDYAAGSNPELRRATNSAGLNGVEMRNTWIDQILPSANLTLFQTAFTGNLTRQALDDFGNPRPNPSTDWNYFSNTQHRLQLNWSFQGASLFQTHRSQALVNDDRDLERMRALTDVQIEVQRLFIDALEQRELLELEGELIEARATDLDIAERLFTLAVRTRVDVLNAELEIERQALAHRRQQTTYERALLSLRTAIGLTDERDITVEDAVLPLFDPVNFDAISLISRALEVNPSVLQSEVAIRTAEVELSQQKSAWWPQIDMGVAVYRQAYEPEGAALFDRSIAKDLESNFYVQFSIPILNGLTQQDLQKQRAAVTLSNQRETDRQARLELEATIRGAVLDLSNEWESHQLSERAGIIAGEALRLAREEYRLGIRSFEDLRTTVQQDADTRRQAIAARHSFVDALLALEAAVGSSVREMIPGSAVGAGS